MTSKRPELETQDAQVRRIEDPARHVPLEQLALGPQCGLSSTVHGNELSEERSRASSMRRAQA